MLEAAPLPRRGLSEVNRGAWGKSNAKEETVVLAEPMGHTSSVSWKVGEDAGLSFEVGGRGTEFDQAVDTKGGLADDSQGLQ